MTQDGTQLHVTIARNRNESHGTSTRAEAWRGFKFGAKWAAIIFGAMVVFVVIFLSSMEILRRFSGDARPLNDYFYQELPKAIFGTIGGILLASLYGGIAGAIVMALGAIVRKRRETADAGESGLSVDAMQ